MGGLGRCRDIDARSSFEEILDRCLLLLFCQGNSFGDVELFKGLARVDLLFCQIDTRALSKLFRTEWERMIFVVFPHSKTILPSVTTISASVPSLFLSGIIALRPSLDHPISSGMGALPQKLPKSSVCNAVSPLSRIPHQF